MDFEDYNIYKLLTMKYDTFCLSANYGIRVKKRSGFYCIYVGQIC